jgi:hypothetical protein
LEIVQHFIILPTWGEGRNKTISLHHITPITLLQH